MTPVPSPRDALRLRGEIERELGALDRAARRVADLAVELAQAAATDKEESALGKRLSDAYTAVERVFRSIAATFEGVPRGPDWHRDLLTGMRTEVPTLRPAVIAEATARLLEEFFGFRHVFRSLYADDLARDRLLDLAAKLPPAAAAFRADLGGFLTFVDRLAAAGS